MSKYDDFDTMDLDEVLKEARRRQSGQPARPDSGRTAPPRRSGSRREDVWDADGLEDDAAEPYDRAAEEAYGRDEWNAADSEPYDWAAESGEDGPAADRAGSSGRSSRPGRHSRSGRSDVYGRASSDRGAPSRSDRSYRRAEPDGESPYGDEEDGGEPPRRDNVYREPPKKKKKRRGFGRFLLILLLLIAAAVIAALLFAHAPQRSTDGLGARKGDIVNVLIAGTDQGGTRTDTIMIVSINKKDGQITLVSVPRDTLVDNVYESQKINSVYGYNGCGADGMEALMDELTQILGIRLDGYMLVDLNAFKDLVDTMGGVWFDVPQDMQYSDPTQDLNIDLTAGYQHLDGEHAMELVRYRSYAMADLQRVNVQRDFIQAALKQWLSLKNVLKIPQVLKLLQANVTTDLNRSNMLWLALQLKKCGTDDLNTLTLPGTPGMYDGVSFFVLDPAGVADTVNQYLNPYEEPVTADMLTIKSY